MGKPESLTLYFREGSSDKEYHASLEEIKGKGWIVNFKYGRRGNAGTAGTKTTSPVNYDEARKIYVKLVNSKTSKGYIEENGNVPFL